MANPRSAVEHYRSLQRLQSLSILTVRRIWQRMSVDGNWSEQYRGDIGKQLLVPVLAAQVAATRQSDSYVAAVLAELDVDSQAVSGIVPATALAGYAGDGRPADTLLAQAVPVAGRAFTAAAQPSEDAAEFVGAVPVNKTLAAQQALATAGRWLEMVTQTLIADTARAAESVAMVANPRATGYVRMLNPPSCSRCAILAGRWYRWSAGFERHPLCDCIHIPAREALHHDLRLDPEAYFESLTPAQQDRFFTKAGAQAIRDGADLNQVVNARRGMTTASQLLGRGATRERLLTTEGTTARGAYGRSAASRTAGARRVRLMPEAIYELSGDDRDEAIRLLRLYGYIEGR